jgi:hypothetical protein
VTGRWNPDGRPPCLVESSGHGGTVVLVLILIASVFALAGAL